MAKKTHDKYKRRRTFIGMAVAVLLVFLGATIFSDLHALNAQRRELALVNEQIEQQREVNGELTRIIESGTDEERLERIAREKLGYVDPNERVYIDSAS